MKIKKIKRREVQNIVADSLRCGTLIIEELKDGKKKPIKLKPVFCSICKKKIGDSLNDYVYFILNDKKLNDVIEKNFCSKKCWEKFINKEIKNQNL